MAVGRNHCPGPKAVGDRDLVDLDLTPAGAFDVEEDDDMVVEGGVATAGVDDVNGLEDGGGDGSAGFPGEGVTTELETGAGGAQGAPVVISLAGGITSVFPPSPPTMAGPPVGLLVAGC